MSEQLEEEKYQGRVLGKPGIKANFILSQKDYRATPYRDTEWEVIGERFTDRNFAPLELEVVPSKLAKTDPMFADFGASFTDGRDSFFHSANGESGIAKKEPEAPVFDPAIIEAELSQRFEEGREAGRKEGQELAESIIEERHAEMQARFEMLAQEMRDELTRCIQQLQTNAAALALNVSKKILLTTADAKPEYIFEVIRHGIQSLSGSTPLRVRVSQQDFEFLEVIGLPKDISTAEIGVEYVADENIQTGCVIETSFGEVDLQLDHMWEQVRANLFGTEK